MRRSQRIVRSVTAAVLSACFAGPALAQISGLLQSQALTAPQREIGRVVEIICPPGNLLSTDLQDRCNEIVNAILIPTSITNGLAGLQGMANEENSVVGTSASDLETGRPGGAAARVQSARTGNLASTLTVNGRSVVLGRDAGNGVSAGELGFSPWSVFANVAYAASDRNATSRQSGFQTDSLVLNAGGEYQINRSAFLGAVLGFASHDSELDLGAGTVDTEDYTFEVYGSYFSASGWYVDALAGVGASDIEQDRNIRYQVTVPVVQTARSDTDSSQWWASIQLGYEFTQGGWNVGPYARLGYSEVDIDGFRERMSNPGGAGGGLATEMDSQDITSVPLAFGVRFARTFPLGRGASLTPQATVEWVHEFANDNDDVTGRFVDDTSRTTFRLPTDEPDRSYGSLSLGASYAFSDTVSAHVVYQSPIGFRDLNTHAIQAGARFSW